MKYTYLVQHVFLDPAKADFFNGQTCKRSNIKYVFTVRSLEYIIQPRLFRIVNLSVPSGSLPFSRFVRGVRHTYSSQR